MTLDIELEGVATDPWGGTRVGFAGSGDVDREDFDMTWNQALETGGFLVGKGHQIELDIEAVLHAGTRRTPPRSGRRSRRSATTPFLSDCETMALVAPSGNIEWLCVPRVPDR